MEDEENPQTVSQIVTDNDNNILQQQRRRWKPALRNGTKKQQNKRKDVGAISENNILLIMTVASFVIDVVTWIILYIDISIPLFTRNGVILGMFWVDVWAFMSIYVASLKPFPPIWQVILGPIGYILHQRPHKRASIIFQVMCICFYALAASQMDTEQIFRYSFLLAKLSIMCYFWSERKAAMHTIITTIPGREKQNSGTSHMFIFANEYIYFITKKRYDNLLNTMGRKSDSHNLNKSKFTGNNIENRKDNNKKRK